MDCRTANQVGTTIWQHAPNNLQHATNNLQHAPNNMQHAPNNMQHATNNMQHATNNMQQTTCNMQQITGIRQQATWNVSHAACYFQNATCRAGALLRHRAVLVRHFCALADHNDLAAEPSGAHQPAKPKPDNLYLGRIGVGCSAHARARWPARIALNPNDPPQVVLAQGLQEQPEAALGADTIDGVALEEAEHAVMMKVRRRRYRCCQRRRCWRVRQWRCNHHFLSRKRRSSAPEEWRLAALGAGRMSTCITDGPARTMDHRIGSDDQNLRRRKCVVHTRCMGGQRKPRDSDDHCA